MAIMCRILLERYLLINLGTECISVTDLFPHSVMSLQNGGSRYVPAFFEIQAFYRFWQFPLAFYFYFFFCRTSIFFYVDWDPFMAFLCPFLEVRERDNMAWLALT